MKKQSRLELASIAVTRWIGTTQSIIVHTILFIVIFSLYLIGVEIDQILLILTTAVSLEAIYLALFIQMTVNRNTEDIVEVADDIDQIQEDVQDLEENLGEVADDVEGLESNVMKINTNVEEIEDDFEKLDPQTGKKEVDQDLTKISAQLTALQQEIASIKAHIERSK